MTEPSYRHHQTSYWPMIVVVAPLALVAMAIALTFRSLETGVVLPLIVSALIVLVRLALSRLRTEVDDGEVRASYPLGPTKTIRLAGIVDHEVVWLPWYYGAGGVLRVRRMGRPASWAFSVWGTEALEIHYHTDRPGEKTFLIGTDDATGLQQAIRTAQERRWTS